MRLGSDALSNANSLSITYTRKISHWAETSTGGNPQQIKGGYYLNGAPLPGANYFTIFFAPSPESPLHEKDSAMAYRKSTLNLVSDNIQACSHNRFERCSRVKVTNVPRTVAVYDERRLSKRKKEQSCHRNYANHAIHTSS